MAGGGLNSYIDFYIYNVKGCYRFNGQAKIIDDGCASNSETNLVYGCSFAVMWNNSPGDIILSRSHNDNNNATGGITPFTGCVVVCKSASNITIQTNTKNNNLGADSNAVSVYNYGGGNTFSGGSSNIVGNPNFVGGNVVTVQNESPTTVASRNFDLTATGSCRNNFTPPTNPLPNDILNRART